MRRRPPKLRVLGPEDCLLIDLKPGLPRGAALETALAEAWPDAPDILIAQPISETQTALARVESLEEIEADRAGTRVTSLPGLAPATADPTLRLLIEEERILWAAFRSGSWEQGSSTSASLTTALPHATGGYSALAIFFRSKDSLALLPRIEHSLRPLLRPEASIRRRRLDPAASRRTRSFPRPHLRQARLRILGAALLCLGLLLLDSSLASLSERASASGIAANAAALAWRGEAASREARLETEQGPALSSARSFALVTQALSRADIAGLRLSELSVSDPSDSTDGLTSFSCAGDCPDGLALAQALARPEAKLKASLESLTPSLQGDHFTIRGYLND